MSHRPDRSYAAEYDRVVRAARGDRDAFAALVDRYDRKLLYFVRRFECDADRAADIVQDVWLTAFRRLPGLRAPEAFRVWLYRLAHDCVVSQIRRDTNRKTVPLDQEPGSGDGGRTPPHETAELVHLALARLSSEHRAVLALRFLEGMSLEEIAAVVDRPLGTVKSRMHHAKSAFEAAVREIADGNPLR